VEFGYNPAAVNRKLEQAIGGAVQQIPAYIGGGLNELFRPRPGLGKRSQLFQRSAAAAVGEGDPTLSRYGTPGTQTADYNAWRGGGAPPAPILPPPGSRTPITSPNTTFQRADEEYKTLLSQYGGTSGVQQLAGMQSLPTGFTPTGGKQAAGLEDYYAAQRAVGAKNIGEITGALAASDPRYQKGGTLEQWAKANPMLAMREFNKKFPAGAPTQGPSDEAIRAAMGGGTYFPSEGSPSPIANPPSLAGQTSFGNIANPVAPTTALNQGAVMDANRGKENLVPQQAAKTTPDGTMPNLETTAQPQTTLDKVNTFVKTLFPTGINRNFF